MDWTEILATVDRATASVTKNEAIEALRDLADQIHDRVDALRHELKDAEAE